MLTEDVELELIVLVSQLYKLSEEIKTRTVVGQMQELVSKIDTLLQSSVERRSMM